jgi:hypothetical protein
LFSATNVNNYSTFNIISCDDDGGTANGSGFMSVVYATGLQAGQTYYVAVDRFSNSTPRGTFCISVDELNFNMLATSNNCASLYQAPTSNGNSTYTGWQPLMDINSKLIALVRSQAGTDVSFYTVSQNINPGIVRSDPTSGQKYLDRNFSINNPFAANVETQFFFLHTELQALQAVDPGTTIGNLGVTRQTSSSCESDFTLATGTSSYLAQAGNGTSADGLVHWIRVSTPSLSNFYLHSSKAFIPVKVFLQGAWPAIGAGPFYRHRDVTTAWALALNTYALNQPYNVGPFNYAGAESVAPGFFTSSAADTTNIVDWVLVELRDATTPTTVISQRAAFIREDGRIVDLNGVDSLSFRGVATGSYFLVIRHRNHLSIRSAATQAVDGALGSNAPGLYDFTTSPSQAFQNTAPALNLLFKGSSGLTPQTYGMWAGNVNYVTTSSLSHTQVRATGGQVFNDYLQMLNIPLTGNFTKIVGTSVAPVYNSADLNLDGVIRATGGINLNDYLILLNFGLGGNFTTIITQQ